jgi:hypothetical protein
MAIICSGAMKRKSRSSAPRDELTGLCPAITGYPAGLRSFACFGTATLVTSHRLIAAISVTFLPRN